MTPSYLLKFLRFGRSFVELIKAISCFLNCILLIFCRVGWIRSVGFEYEAKGVLVMWSAFFSDEILRVRTHLIFIAAP